MKNINKLITLLFMLCISISAFADSPLTSTNFSNAYQDVEIVVKASKSGGILTNGLMEYLIDRDKPVDIKMAVINELSWDINGKSNADIFMQFLKAKKIYKSDKKFYKKASGDILLSLAYLKALDNYNNVDEAMKIANYALKKNQTGYTYNIITSLIKAQKAFDSDWCQVYMLTHKVRINKALKIDMRNEAIRIIFDYMDLYKGDCK